MSIWDLRRLREEWHRRFGKIRECPRARANLFFWDILVSRDKGIMSLGYWVSN